jgi:DNA-binding transcriptional LysR family regulator
MKNLDDLSFFLTIVEAGSLTLAAKWLSIPKSKLSRRLAQLEEELGSQLLVRTTRKQQLTESGQLLYQSCKPHIEALKSAEVAISDFIETPKGKLKILLPLEFFNKVMAELITEFAILYPEISVHCEHYSRSIPEQDLSYDLIFVLHEQALPESNWIGKTLLSFPQSIYAAKSLALSCCTTPEELTQYPCILSEENQSWLFRGKTNIEIVQPKPHMILASPEMRLSAVKRNLGIVKLPDYVVSEEQQQNNIERLSFTKPPVAQQLTVLYQSRSIVKKTRVFLDFFQSNIGCLSSN